MNDDRIQFIEKDHKYLIDGKEDNISVTKLIKEFFPIFDADVVIEKMQKKTNWKDSIYYDKTVDEIKQEWREKAENASRLGTLLHKTIEKYYKKESINDSLIKTEMDQFQKFNKEHIEINKLKPFRSEWIVFDEKYHIAGSIDMIYIDEESKELHLYDWKRINKLKKNNKYQKGLFPLHMFEDCNYFHYSLQLNLYKYILEQNYGHNVNSMKLVCFHPDNENYIIEEINDYQDIVLQLLKYVYENKLYEKK